MPTFKLRLINLPSKFINLIHKFPSQVKTKCINGRGSAMQIPENKQMSFPATIDSVVKLERWANGKE
jgi:hypothetical protein